MSDRKLEKIELGSSRVPTIGPTEARKVARRDCLDMALIRFGDTSVSCVIRNQNDAGAALDVGARSDIPDRFTMVTTKKIYSCSVVWRKNRRIGVAFS